MEITLPTNQFRQVPIRLNLFFFKIVIGYRFQRKYARRVSGTYDAPHPQDPNDVCVGFSESSNPNRILWKFQCAEVEWVDVPTAELKKLMQP